MHTSGLAICLVVALVVGFVQGHNKGEVWFHGHASGSGKAHSCVHDLIAPSKKKTVRAKQQGSSSDRERLRRSGTSPLRLHFHFGRFDGLADKQYIEDIMAEAQWWLHSALKVTPVAGDLQLAFECSSRGLDGSCNALAPLQCGDFTAIPRSFFADLDDHAGGPGVPNADTIVFVSAMQSELCASGSVAYAFACQRDSDTDRPIAGWLNFCPMRATRKIIALDRRTDVDTAIHEILHILGFSNQNFAFFRDESGVPRTPRCGEGAPEGTGDGECDPTDQDIQGDPPLRTVLGQRIPYVSESTVKIVQERGHTVAKLVTPEVQRVVREHFGCDTLDGLELEDYQSFDTSGVKYYGSHAEKRVYVNDIMVASVSSHWTVSKSKFVLAALQDSGWYDVDYAAAEPFSRGLDGGCEFATAHCDPTSSDWCSDATAPDLCTFNRQAKGVCALGQYGSIPDQYQYFDSPTLGGADLLLDYCPLVEPVEHTDGRSGRCDNQINPVSWTHRGEQFGASSLCMQSRLWKEGEPNEVPWLNGCYLTRCVKDNPEATDKRLQIQAAGSGTWQECSGGGYIYFAGYRGNVTCPDEVEVERLCAARDPFVISTGLVECNMGLEDAGNGVGCRDVDECAASPQTCSTRAECINVEGSFACRCSEGFSGDGVVCADSDECTTGAHNCHAHAECKNSAGGFECACVSGFSGDGVQCAEEVPDPCDMGVHTCHEDAECTEAGDSEHSCACRQGYAGDGHVCLAEASCGASQQECNTVSFTAVLGMSKSDFQAKQSDYISSVAAAAGVSTSAVAIGVPVESSTRRRGRALLATTVSVPTMVATGTDASISTDQFESALATSLAGQGIDLVSAAGLVVDFAPATSPPASTPEAPVDDEGSSSSVGLIAGAAGGGVALVVALCAAAWVVRSRRKATGNNKLPSNPPTPANNNNTVPQGVAPGENGQTPAPPAAPASPGQHIPYRARTGAVPTTQPVPWEPSSQGGGRASGPGSFGRVSPEPTAAMDLNAHRASVVSAASNASAEWQRMQSYMAHSGLAAPKAQSPPGLRYEGGHRGSSASAEWNRMQDVMPPANGGVSRLETVLSRSDSQCTMFV